jgi:hypothetical protein
MSSPTNALALAQYLVPSEKCPRDVFDAIVKATTKPLADRVRELVERGAQRPSYNQKNAVVCMHCLTSLRHNITALRDHLVNKCQQCPIEVADTLSPTLSDLKSLRCTPSKRPISQASPATSEAPTQSAQSAGFAVYLDKRFAKARQLVVDQAVAEWIYATGQPFEVVSSPEFKSMMATINGSFWQSAKLTSWRLRHQYLDTQHRRVSANVRAQLKDTKVLTLLMDGWSGLQRRHMLNILLATPIPYFLANVYTGAESTTSEFHERIVSQHLTENNIKVTAIVTDNAAVMRKFWRLFEAKHPGTVAIGCACHALELLAKDCGKQTVIKGTLDDCVTIVKWFRRHLQAGGLATLRAYQLEVNGKAIALQLPSSTRWHSAISCVQSLIKTRLSLFGVVTDRSWDNTDPVARMIRRRVVDEHFWSLLDTIADLLAPLKVYIKLLQANSAYLSDVYAAFMMLQVHFEGSEFGILTDLHKRSRFILHPCHLAAAILDHRYVGYLAVDPKLMATVLINLATHIAKRPESDILIPSLVEISKYAKAIRERDLTSVEWQQESMTLTPLTWWELFGYKQWPALFSLVQILFRIPCSAAAAERFWSNAGFIINERRTRLSEDHVDKLMSIYFNTKALKWARKSSQPVVIKMQEHEFVHDFANLHLIHASSADDALPKESNQHDNSMDENGSQDDEADGHQEVNESDESEVEPLSDEDESSVEVQDDEVALQEPFSKLHPFEGEVAEYNPDHSKAVRSCLSTVV